MASSGSRAPSARLTADAAFNHGNDTSPPKKGLAAWSQHWAAWVYSQEWWRRELFKPRWKSVDELIAQRTLADFAPTPTT